MTCIICIAADVSQSETTTNSRNKKGNTGTISTGITTGTISTGITVESSSLVGDQGDQCLWLLWLTLAHLFTSPETYIY